MQSLYLFGSPGRTRTADLANNRENKQNSVNTKHCIIPTKITFFLKGKKDRKKWGKTDQIMTGATFFQTALQKFDPFLPLAFLKRGQSARSKFFELDIFKAAIGDISHQAND